MDAWQRGNANDVAFVCVGCGDDGPAEMAARFSKRMKLTDTQVAVALDKPSWGQLGCNGFIVFDKDLRVVCRQSAAFLKVRSLAFRHVEAVINALMTNSEVPSICPGVAVKISGLSTEEDLDGERALCLERADTLCTVALLSGRKLSVKVDNLVRDPEGDEHMEAYAAAAAAEEDSQTSAPTSACADGSCSRALPNFFQGAREVARLDKIESVGVPELDAEHEACAAALESLFYERTTASLRKVQEAFQKHFEHEEELLDRHLYSNLEQGEQGSEFNAGANQRTSHFSDHARIMRSIAEFLGRGRDTVTVQFVDSVMRDFETHANTYDDTYAAPLAAKLAAEA